MYQLRASILAIGLAFAGGSTAVANDSAAELSIGGLHFARTPNVEMRSEDLRISLDRVSVRYEFVNTSTAPVTLTVAFPLPDIDLAEGESVSFPSNDPLNFVDFATKVDGAAIKFNVDQRAFIGDKEVTSQLRELKVPLLPLGTQQFRPGELPAATRTRMASDGLLIPAGSDERGRALYSAGWIVKTAVYREQVFPPGKGVVVEHTYRPSVGASPDTILRKTLRQNKAMAKEVERYRKDYCVSEEFLQELDKLAGSLRDGGAMVQERRVSYILKTGANWAGPIKSFHLSIDRGGHLVSYCPGKLAAGAAKQALEVTATDFTPERDIKVLFVGKF
ncbi:DUF4424 domain-containing protein [Bradyrhizobium sp. AUGA SZCCT0182]|uniref:DUF4424 domain-containing protein n=1 Tax=Bradyrhizobium sp. AUGA SZCCT0182 TaxID=2807667 RepID=UPI001BAD5990|nr:DUF4424 domain-containing protein [Bradyrhizobium sp. AUGA SZCCT0182]MBR1232055.1 DUF4424 domain-containing protein [Bradyrhizobium sp. AUGA SZCCT0182]